MALPTKWLEDLRAAVPIMDVIGRRVRLTRKGRDEATGLCPFHNEKTPSFTVSGDKGFFHCFGCGAHGDVISFVMRTEGLEFRPAVEKLAAEAGMEVPRDSAEDRARAERIATLADVTEFAAKWFEQQLHAAAGRPARDYLVQRGVRDQTIREFRLGYAPDSRTALKSALDKAGVAEELAVEAGLLIKPPADEGRHAPTGGGRTFDRFRGRLVFPIMNARGQVIAFGGRIIGSGEPKYLNSPETPLFHKGRALYALHSAQASARERDEILVVEGYMDVIALWQAGIRNAVAPLGTALTEGQIHLLWRLASEPLLCFDGDRAGRAAAARAAHRAIPLLQPGRSLTFGWMPEGHDPDSLVKEKGADGFRAAVDRAVPMVSFLWHHATDGRSLDTPERRAGLAKDLSAIVQQIKDETVRTSYDEEFRFRLGALNRKLMAQAARAEEPEPDQPFESDAWQAVDTTRVPEALRGWHEATVWGSPAVEAWLEDISCDVAAMGGAPEALRFVGNMRDQDGQLSAGILAAVQDLEGVISGVWELPIAPDGRTLRRPHMRGLLKNGAVQLSQLRRGEPLYIGVDLVQMLHVMSSVRRAKRPGAFWATIDLSYLPGAPHPDGWKSARFHPTQWIEPTEPGQRRRRKRLPATMPDMERPGVIPPVVASEIVIVAPLDGDLAVQDALMHRAAQRFQRMGFKVRMTAGRPDAPVRAAGQ